MRKKQRRSTKVDDAVASASVEKAGDSGRRWPQSLFRAENIASLQRVHSFAESAPLERPETWLEANERARVHQEALLVTKQLFDLGMRVESQRLGPLLELFVDRFDSEQIWQQIELHNKPLFSLLQRKLDHLLLELATSGDDPSWFRAEREKK